MASGISRSPWLPRLCMALDWPRAKMYSFLKRNGYKSPYLDEARALRLLTNAGIKIPAQYRPSKSPLSAGEVATVKAVAAASGTHKMTEEAKRKFKETWAMKLVPRLARLLPEGDTPKGKDRVKRILRTGGYEGPRWEDEERALAIFRTVGIDITGFERVGGNGKAVVVASERPEQLSFVPKPAPPVATVDKEDAKRLQRVFNLLNAYEHQMMQLIRSGAITRLSSPLELPINALNELRPALKA